MKPTTDNGQPATNLKSPKEIFGDLFVALHELPVHPDGKVITDAVPQAAPPVILDKYAAEKDKPGFDLKAFFNKHFKTAATPADDFESDTSQSVEQHIERLWDVLYRPADTPGEGSSLIPLPHPYIVPGGRFNEIYYWDSYFTMLGLKVSGRFDLIEAMLDNFAHLIDTVGFIPNGNRTYYTGRSQPPFFALMVELLAEAKGKEIYVKYLSALRKEYDFWMEGAEDLDENNRVGERVVLLGKKDKLNRYYDRDQRAREEMYGEDTENLAESGRAAEDFFLDVRAACESGWDFSSRWLQEDLQLTGIRTSEIIPVDLNCLMYKLEITLVKAYKAKRDRENQVLFIRKSKTRFSVINRYFWNTVAGVYCDYHFPAKKLLNVKSLAGVYPLFCEAAKKYRAERCAQTLQQDFLRPGGLVTSTVESGQQWDAPNGWAPLQWIAVQGLRNYRQEDLAKKITKNWLALNRKVFKETGKMLEKYNVEDISLLSGGGEYPVQDGFGWTNGVFLALAEGTKTE